MFLLRCNVSFQVGRWYKLCFKRVLMFNQWNTSCPSKIIIYNLISVKNSQNLNFLNSIIRNFNQFNYKHNFRILRRLATSYKGPMWNLLCTLPRGDNQNSIFHLKIELGEFEGICEPVLTYLETHVKIVIMISLSLWKV